MPSIATSEFSDVLGLDLQWFQLMSLENDERHKTEMQ